MYSILTNSGQRNIKKCLQLPNQTSEIIVVGKSQSREIKVREVKAEGN